MSVSNLVLFALLGVGTGGLIAGIAIGLVITYRGSGTMNLATGGVAMVTAYAFWAFKTGEFGPKFDTPVSLVLTIVVALLLGVLMELLVFRPLRTAPQLAKLVATLGILLALQAGVLLAFGANPKIEPSIFPRSTVDLFSVHVPINRFILAGIVVAIALALIALYRWTRFGVSTRAVSENETAGTLIGLSPNSLAMANTLLACLIVGILGVVVAPVTTLDATSLPLMIVPGLAAALFAGFSSIGVACIVGLLIGAGQNILYYLSTQPWFPQDAGVQLPGVSELLVFLLIVIALYFRGGSLPGRGEVLGAERLPGVPIPERLMRAAGATALVGVLALVVFPYDFRQALLNTMIAAVLMMSLVVITGYVGQISVVQLALSGVAGFILVHVTKDAGIGVPFGALIAIAGATVLGVLIAISALRVRGVQLVVVTLAAAVAIEQFWFANSTWGAGQSGARVPQPHLFGLNLGTTGSFRGLDGKIPSPVFGFIVLAIAIAIGLLVSNLRRTDLGRRMLAVRSNERAAAAAGISVRNVKVAAFALGSFVAGVAGTMYAYNYGSVSAQSFSALTALGIIAFVYIGGITMVSGAVIGALISTEALFPYFFQRFLGISGTWALLVGGLVLIFNLIFYPEGVAGALRAQREEKRRVRASGAGTEVSRLLPQARTREG